MILYYSHLSTKVGIPTYPVTLTGYDMLPLPGHYVLISVDPPPPPPPDSPFTGESLLLHAYGANFDQCKKSKSKNRKKNGQKKRDKKTNKDLQNTKQKIKQLSNMKLNHCTRQNKTLLCFTLPL